jgi:hypothetical protein
MESWVLLGHRYVVFLVFNYVDGHLSNTDAKERVPTLVGQPLLPINNRAAKDSRAKDEKPMNGNSENHSSDWRQWMPLDNGSPTAMQVVDNEN